LREWASFTFRFENIHARAKDFRLLSQPCSHARNDNDFALKMPEAVGSECALAQFQRRMMIEFARDVNIRIIWRKQGHKA